MNNRNRIIKKLMVILIILIISGSISAGFGKFGKDEVFRTDDVSKADKVPSGDIEWVDPQEKTLRLAESFIRDDFLIEASSFFNDTDLMVLITVYDKNDGNVISEKIARKDDSWNVKDRMGNIRMNITIKELREKKGNTSASSGLNVVVDQWVKVQTRLTGYPKPILSVIPLERKTSNNRTIIDRIFVSGSEISINFSIKNEGKAILRGMHLIINKSEVKELPFLFSYEKLDRELPNLKVNESVIINIRFRAPFVNERKNFTISANVYGIDAFGREYNVTDSTHIMVRPFLEEIIDVTKHVPEKRYMGDIIYVTVYIKNNGWGNISGLNFTEIISKGFEPLDDFYKNNLTNFTLRGYENKQIMYKLRPERPGIYTFPAESSKVEWEGGVEYNDGPVKLIVNGPYVELKKSGMVEGDNIRIKIEAKNLGDMTAIVRLRDFVPKSGPITKAMVVRPSSLTTFSYIINIANVTDIISDGKVALPRAEAVVFDQFLYQDDKYTQRIKSNDVVIDIIE